MWRRVFLLAFCGVVFFAARSFSDDAMVLESGDFSSLESLENAAPEWKALRLFYQQRLGEAYELLQNRADLPEKLEWVKNYLSAAQPLWADMTVSTSAHFDFYCRPRDRFLAEDALEVLEQAHQNLGSILGAFPKEKVRVELYSQVPQFSQASTLSQEILDRSGAVGICKFRRIMILSPENTVFGFPWKDTLGHEYTHYLINVVSGGYCPLWMHEGIARYLESRWKNAEAPSSFLSAGDKNALLKAQKNNELISFAQMRGSLVYLENNQQVGLAFAEVSYAISLLAKHHGIKILSRLLENIRLHKGDVDAAFLAILRQSPSEFESFWRAELQREKWQIQEGALTPRPVLGASEADLQKRFGPDAAETLRLADRLWMRGHEEAALKTYEKVLALEPFNPTALTHQARLLLAQKQPSAATEACRKAVQANPHFGPAWALLGEALLAQNKRDGARDAWEKALEINPYHQPTRQKLILIYQSENNLAAETKMSEALKALEK